MTPQERKLRNARAQIVHAHPFFGTLLLRQRVVETTTVQTMATNGKELFFNPEFVDEIEMPELRGVCAHEALHPAFCHHTRRGDRDHELWNMACDYVINPVLIEAGLTLPKGALIRDDLRGLNAEQAYARLIEERQQQQDQQDASGRDDNDETGEGDESHAQPDESPSDANPDGSRDDDDNGETEGESTDTGDGAGDSDPDAADASQGGASASGSNDDGEDAQAHAKDFGGCGAILDAPADTPEERQDEEREWRVALAQAAQAEAMAEGSIGGELRRMIDATLEAQSDWRDLLRRYMDQFARSDYSWKRQDRRYITRGIYLPALHDESIGPIAFVIDASGSMPQESLNQAASELQAIVDELRPERVDVIVHDTAIVAIESFEPGDAITLDVKAGGGTSYVDVAEWLSENDEHVCAVWFTDLQCSRYGNEPPTPILWLDFSDSTRMPRYGDDVVRMPR
jgi:predicted metal-dependent peptidase